MARTYTYKPILEIDARYTSATHINLANTRKYTNEGKYRQLLYQTWCKRGSIEHVLANGRLSKVLDLFPPYPFSFNESYVSRVNIHACVHTLTHDGQHVRHVCAENWIRRGSRGPASVISQSCQGLTLYNVIYKELTMDDRRGDWKLCVSNVSSLGFFSCNVFLLLVGIRYSCTFVAKVLEKYRSKGDKRNFWHDLIFRNCTVLRFAMKICGLGF